MNKRVQKIAALSISTLIGTGAIATTVDAASLTRNLKATYNNIRVIYDGDQVMPNREPFLVDGTVYVSLRDAGQITGNGVTWADNAVHITSGSGANNQLVLQKDMQIAMLSKKVADLEAKLQKPNNNTSSSTSNSGKEDTSSPNINNVLKDIRDKYEKASSDNLRIDWKIDLEEKKDKILLTLEYADKDDQETFKRATTSKTESFLRDICEIISDRLDIKVEGEIIDAVKSDVQMGEFTYSTSGSLNYTKLKVTSSIETFETHLLDKYKKKVPYLVNQGNVLYGRDTYMDGLKLRERSSNKYEFIIDIRLSSAEEEDWNSQGVRNKQANTREIENIMENIRNEIAEEFDAKKDDITGYIYGNSGTMVEYNDDRLTISEI